MAAVSCTTLTEAGERVRFVDDPGKVRGCKYLGEIEGTAMLTAPGQRLGGNALIAEDSAANEARNQAGDLGADTLLSVDEHLEVFEATAKGRAYRCGD